MKTWYLIETASDRMGGGSSYTSMEETELLNQPESFLNVQCILFTKRWTKML
jgi:hypothetical protein